MPDTFQYGDIPKPDKFLQLKLKQLGIDDPVSIVHNYLKSRQPPEPGKVVQLEQPKKQNRISAEVCRVI